MPVLRELLVKLGFKLDAATVQKAEDAINGVKQSAEALDQALGVIGAAAAKAGEKARSAFSEVPDKLKVIDEQAKMLGQGFSAADAKAKMLAGTIRQMAELGVEATSPMMRQLGAMRAQFAKEAERSEGGMLAKVGGSIKETALAVSGPIAALFAAEQATEHFADFQQTRQKTGAAMRESQAGIDEMTRRATSWALRLGRSPREIGEAMQELGSQGFGRQAVEAMTPLAVKLARAGLTDVSSATAIIGATTRAFYGEDVSKTVYDAGGRKSTAAGSIADIVAMVHDLGNIKVPELAESLKYSATTFHALEQSAADLGTLTAVLGQAGIKDSSAGASLRTMALKLAAPMSVFKTRLEAAGLGQLAAHATKGENMLQVLGLSKSDITDASGRMRSLVDIFAKVIEKTKGMTMVQRAGVFKQLFGLENATQALAIAGKLGPAFEHIRDQVGNATGRLDQMYTIMNRGRIPAWQRFTGALETVADLLLAVLSPVLEGTMDAFSGLVNVIARAVDWMKSASPIAGALRLALVALAPGALLLALEAIATTIGVGIIPKMYAWAASMVPVVAEWVALNWLVFLVGAAIAAVFLVVQDLMSKNSVILRAMHAAWAKMPGPIKEVIGWIGHLAQAIWQFLASLPAKAYAGFMAFAQNAINALKSIPGIGMFIPAFRPGGALASVAPGAGTGGGIGSVYLHVPVSIMVYGNTDHQALAGIVRDHIHAGVRTALASAGNVAPRRKR